MLERAHGQKGWLKKIRFAYRNGPQFCIRGEGESCTTCLKLIIGGVERLGLQRYELQLVREQLGPIRLVKHYKPSDNRPAHSAKRCKPSTTMSKP